MSWLSDLFGSGTPSPASWSAEQQKRLQFERSILARYFPAFIWESPRSPGSASVVGTMRSNAGNSYGFQLKVPVDVPNSVPELLLRSPCPIYDHWGKSLVKYGTSSTMHLLSPEGRYVKICHYRATHWGPNVTFYKVLMKARLWIEAYEGHRATGNSIDHYLKHQS